MTFDPFAQDDARFAQAVRRTRPIAARITGAPGYVPVEPQDSRMRQNARFVASIARDSVQPYSDDLRERASVSPPNFGMMPDARFFQAVREPFVTMPVPVSVDPSGSAWARGNSFGTGTRSATPLQRVWSWVTGRSDVGPTPVALANDPLHPTTQTLVTQPAPNAFGHGVAPQVDFALPLPMDNPRMAVAVQRPFGDLVDVQECLTPANFGLRSQARHLSFMSQVGVMEPSLINVGGRHWSPTFNIFRIFSVRQTGMRIVVPGGVTAITTPADLNPIEPPSLR